MKTKSFRGKIQRKHKHGGNLTLRTKQKPNLEEQIRVLCKSKKRLTRLYNNVFLKVCRDWRKRKNEMKRNRTTTKITVRF